MPIQTPNDLMPIRVAVHELATSIGFRSTETIQITTAVSEIVRNVLAYGQKPGGITASPIPSGLKVHVWDPGPGIPLDRLAQIEEGTYRSSTGLGKGISGARKLMTRFRILTSGKGTLVFMERDLTGKR